MHFTQEDYKKIESWLLRNSVKDTEFQEALPLTGDESVVITQDNHNRNLKIKDFVDEIIKVGITDFLNVTERYKSPNITLKEAIALVPDLLRKKGQVLTFSNPDGNWEIYQFTGALNQWNNVTLWEDVFNIDKFIINSILPDEEDLTKSEVDKSGNSFLSLKDREYNPTEFSGLGRVILRKKIASFNTSSNKIERRNILVKEDITKSNTIYEIRYDFNLNGSTIVIPNDCILYFNGGSIKNGKLILNNTLVYPLGIIKEDVLNCTIEGNFKKGQMFFDKEQGHLSIWDGTNWKIRPNYRVIDNKLNETVDGGKNWTPVSDYIASYFRWGPNNTIQINRTLDDSKWENLSGEFADSVFIKGYKNTYSELPQNPSLGDIYMVGAGAPYIMYVSTSEGWKDNGQFTSISAGVVQTTGQSTTEVMSQKAVTEKLTELESNVADNTIDLSMMLSGEFVVSSDTWPLKEGYYARADMVTPSTEYKHAIVPINNAKSITFEGATVGVNYGWKKNSSGQWNPLGTSAGTKDISDAVELILNFFFGDFASAFTISFGNETFSDIVVKVNNLELQSNGASQLETLYRNLLLSGKETISVDNISTMEGYITNTGVINANSNYRCAKIALPSNVKAVEFESANVAAVGMIFVVLKDGAIRYAATEGGRYNAEDAAFLWVNFFGEGFASEYTIITSKSIAETDDNLKSLSDVVNGDTSYSVKGRYLNQNTGEENGGAVYNTTPFIKVYEGDVIKVDTYTYGSLVIACYDKNKKYLPSVSVKADEDKRVTMEFVVPSGVGFIRSSSADGMGEDGKLEIVTSERVGLIVEKAISSIDHIGGETEKLKYTNCLAKPFDFNGKKALFFGDSITYGVESFEPNNDYLYGLKNAGDKKYSSLLCARLGMTEVNKAISGSSFCKLNNSAVNSITETIQGTTSAADYIFVAGGVNDFQTGEPVGALGDTTNATFYGCLDLSCKHLKNTYPNAVVIFITPINWCQSTDKDAIAPLNTYRNAIFEVATKYGFNVLDGSLVGFPTDSKSPFRPIMMYDGCHPTELGHSLYAKTLAGILL